MQVQNNVVALLLLAGHDYWFTLEFGLKLVHLTFLENTVNFGTKQLNVIAARTA